MVFPLMALGAGLGQFAQQYREQQESAMRQAMQQIQMQRYQQQMDQEQRERSAQGAAFKLAGSGSLDNAFGGRPGSPDATTGYYQPRPTPSVGGGGMMPGGALTTKFDPNDPVEFIPQFESGNRNIMQGVVGPQGGYNPSVGRVTGPSSAGGYWQITNPTWMDFAPKAGVDLAQYPTAISAPREVQKAVANAIYRETGFSRWEPYNQRFSAALRNLNLGSAPEGAGSASGSADLAAGTGQFAMPTDMAAGLGAPQPTGPPDTLIARGGAAARPQPASARSDDGTLVTDRNDPQYGFKRDAGGQTVDYTGATGQPVTVPPATPTDYSKPPPAVAPPPGGGAGTAPAPATAPGAQARAPADPMAQVKQDVMRGVQQTARITPPSVYGRMGLQGLVGQIEKAMPGADDATKFLALQEATKLLAPDAKVQLELYKEQRQHDWARELQQLQADRSERLAKYQHDLRVNDPTSGWGILTDKDGTQYRYNTITSKATSLTGEPYTPQGAQKLGAGGPQTASRGREADNAREINRLDDDWALANPKATQAEKDAQHFVHRKQVETGMAEAKAAPKSDRNIEVRDPTSNELLFRGTARVAPGYAGYVTPDGKPVPDGKIVTIGTAQPRNESQMIMQKFLDENPWARADDAQVFRANRIMNESAMRAFGGGILGRNVVALNTVADHILRVQEYADALRNGQIPRANQVANTIAREKGDPEVTTFDAGRTIMADEVVRLLTATGGSRGDRADMQGLISSMMSPEQFAGIFDMLKHMTGGRLDALKQQFARGDPKREEQFNTQMLSAKGREVWALLTGDPMAQPIPGSPAAPVLPTGEPPKSGAPPAKGRAYKPGDIIEKGGKRYRVIGGDPTDPDVEEVK